MQRSRTRDLISWIDRTERVPLVLRGARQVGKTWLVREAARLAGRDLVELNLERDPSLAGLFEVSDPREVLRGLEVWAGRAIRPESALLFIDEIQAAPHVLASLRWFAEELARLPVVAAGSLLDFALADHRFSMPVGRVGYMYVEPMSFEEFLDALGEGPLLEAFRTFSIGDGHPATSILRGPVHERAMGRLREYLLAGGMPRAVATWRETGSWIEVERVQSDLLATYRDDFAKYSGRVPKERLDRVLLAVPRLLGRKFQYVQVDREERAAALGHALSLLAGARVCHRVRATDATGLPLGAEARDREFKAILLDVGLASSLLGAVRGGLPAPTDVRFVNEGGLAEQLVGQALRAAEPEYVDPELFYWSREQRGSGAELDYVIPHRGRVVPVEVKAGTTGTLRSLHLFMALRELPVALRFDASPPSLAGVSVETSAGPARYRLLSLPLYLAGEARRLLDDLADQDGPTAAVP